MLTAALGVGAGWMAMQDVLPLAFGLLGCLLLLLIAVWNVATLGRTREHPEGAWLVTIAVVTCLAGAAALPTHLWPTGVFALASGGGTLIWGRNSERS